MEVTCIGAAHVAESDESDLVSCERLAHEMGRLAHRPCHAIEKANVLALWKAAPLKTLHAI
jgi:hypothetical protein